VKDKQFLANVFNGISASVTKVNEKIIAYQQRKTRVDDPLKLRPYTRCP
jgi:hypothetical protein